jgi:PAS domain S-box-containing protein
MGQHKLLQKQIKKYLTPDCVENPLFKNFIQAVNDSYVSFERDKEIVNHAFQESEKEYHTINQSLKEEYELKKQSIANLYDTLEVIEDDFEAIQNEENADDLVFVSKYLNRQIEKRKETEKNLSTTVELLKTLLANLQSGILVEDENRKILFTNQMFCDLFSIPMSPESMIGFDCTNSAEQSKDLFVDSENFAPQILNILKNKELSIDERLEMKNGKFLERDYIPIYIKNEYKGHLWKYTDITARIESQVLLEQSEERSRLIMNSALNAIINIDTKGKITFWNNQAEHIFGWKREEVLGKTLQETIIPEQHKKGHVNGMNHYMKTGEGPVLNKQIELPAINKAGVEFLIEIAIIPIKQNDELFFCSFIQDISERKKVENQLKIQEEKYRNIIANMNLGMLEVDNNENIQFANQSFCKISGYEMDELIGKNPSNLFVFGENAEKIHAKRKLREKGKSDIYQIAIKNKRGELRWWAISGAPNYDDKGNLIGTIGIHLDVTEQKQLENDLESEKVKALEASKAKEAFLANMSHEIRTPLNAIIGFLRELERQQVTDIQRKYIENSSIASKHLLSIINNILDISKIEAGEMAIENVDFELEKSIQNIITILEPKAIQKGIKIDADFDQSIAKVFKGDALRIEQILFNLIGNALKFTQKGFISIQCILIHEHNSKQDICISIIDSGIGMDEKFIASIFTKFSQEEKNTTRKFGGTGLGMAITKELIDLMKGKIAIESEKNKGTTIKIYLTLDKGSIKNIVVENTKTAIANLENIKILLVEDNEFNRIVAQNSLSISNCQVTEAENGQQAIDILKTTTFDVILMDIQMPIMDGIEATSIIRNELKINTPIIALTANAFKTEIEKCKQVGMNDHVIKPFDDISLLETISKYVNQPEAAIQEIQTNEKSYDLKSLRSLSRGNEAFVLKMIAIFVKQTKEIMADTEKAIEENNFTEASRLIHKIKPSIDGMGIVSVHKEVRVLERICLISNNKNEINELFVFIKTRLLQAVLELEENELNS